MNTFLLKWEAVLILSYQKFIYGEYHFVDVKPTQARNLLGGASLISLHLVRVGWWE